MSRRLALACSLLALAAASCSDEADTGSASTTQTSPPTSVVAMATTAIASTPSQVPTTGEGLPTSTSTDDVTAPTVPDVLAPFSLAIIGLDGRDLLVAVADEFRLRSRGLMHVEDLGPLDGMIFLWGDDTDETFWMRDTLIPLDIAWFRADGSFVSQLIMVPCPNGETCPNYAATGVYRFAVEMPAGTMGSLDGTSRLVVPDEIRNAAEN